MKKNNDNQQQSEQLTSVIVHYHKHPLWSDCVKARVSSDNAELNATLQQQEAQVVDEGSNWYVVSVDVPQGMLDKKSKLKLEIYDGEQSNIKPITKTFAKCKEVWLAKNGRAKKDASAAEEYEGKLFDWKIRSPETRASLFVMGVAHLKHKRIVEGICMLLVEIGFIVYMALAGVMNIVNFITLGSNKQQIVDGPNGYPITIEGDNSMHMLLYGVITLVIVALFVAFYVFCMRASVRLEEDVRSNRKYSFKATVKSFANDKLHVVMLLVPLTGILIFTIVPLIYMIFIAFTNYDSAHQPPGELFDWVGFENFLYLFGKDERFGRTFWSLFLWTIVWAFFSTFTCFFGGMGLAMLINNKKVKGKVVFRTIFVLTIAIPSFISLLSINTMLQSDGIINVLLMKYGFISEPLPFFDNANWARATVIIVNMWIGVPISMLITTGILLNIPQDLFESARMDGASSFVIFRKIILPYIFFVCTPYLINAFIGNINNFNVIYFLSGGGPLSSEYFGGAGSTDLLVTWLYKLTVDNRDYSYASAIGIIIFLISAGLSLIVFRRSSSFKNEGSF